LIDQQGNPKKEEIEYVKKMDTLSGDEEVIINSGYLLSVVKTYKEYFKLLNESIKVAQKT